MKKYLKRHLLTSLLGSAALSCAIAPMAYAQTEYQMKEMNFSIEAKSVPQALKEFADRANLQLMLAGDTIKSNRRVSLKGRYAPLEALAVLLEGTGLDYFYDGKNSIAIRAKKEKAASGFQKISYNTTSDYQSDMAVSDDDEYADDMGNVAFEEIIVTATKRATSLQDTAISIAAIGAEEISKRGIVSMEDYLKYIPGVSQLDKGAGFNSIIIRGVSTSVVEETSVGVYFGEVPVTSVAGSGAIDLKTVDINRIEVLRGPQGSLYGAASVGGTIRNIPNAPNLSEFEGKVETGYSNTARLGGDNTMIQGVVNIPIIEDKLAIRAVLYRFNDSGYIKNIAGSDPATLAKAHRLGVGQLAQEKIVGGSTYTGGRLSVLWQPVDNLKITASYTKQNLVQNGNPRVNPKLGERAYLVNRVQSGGPLRGKNNERFSKADILNGIIEYDFDWASLHASTSYIEHGANKKNTVSGLGTFVSVDQLFSTSSFIEEIRLTSQHEGPLQYLVGVYYENSENIDDFTIYNIEADRSASPHVSGAEVIFMANTDNDVKQTSLFGEVSYELSTQLKVTAGMRWFDFERSAHTINDDGFFKPALVHTDVTNTTGESGQSYKLNLTYTPNDDMLFYAQWAQGFRLGETTAATDPVMRAACDTNNDGIIDGTSFPLTQDGGLDSDKVNNYELGAKISLLNNRLTVNAAVYQMDWSDIPINFITPCNFTDGRSGVFPFNAGVARTRGFEIETNFYVTDNLMVNLGGSYMRAELGSDTNIGETGDRLPNSPAYQFNVGLQYDFEMKGMPSFIRTDYSYIGNFFNNVAEQGDEAGGYGKLDARIGIAALDQVDIEIYAQNITNENAYTSRRTSSTAFQLRPRTVGMNLRYNF